MTRHQLRLSTAARNFVEAFPIGNGTLGATVYGRPGTERLDLNVDTLWSGGPLAEPTTPPLPSTDAAAADRLAALRQAIRAGEYVTADELARGLQGPGWTQSYQPVGWLEWSHAPEAATAYRRTLDLANAEVITEYDTPAGPVEVRSFVSQPDNVIVVSATGAGAVASPGSLVLKSPHPTMELRSATTAGIEWLIAAGRVPAQVTPNYIETDAAVLYAEDQPDERGTVPAGMGFAVAAAVERLPDEVRVIVGLGSGFRGYQERPSADLDALRSDATGAVESALRIGTDELRRRHRADYTGYFDRVDLDLSDSVARPGSSDPAQAELMFDMGRYLLISSSRPGTQATNLQGIWNIDVRPAWSSNYTTNINVQMNYWGAESLGLPELHQPMIALVNDLVGAGRRTAADYYGAAGSVTHHNTDLWRFTTAVQGDPVWANWASGLNWMSAHLWDQLDYTATVDPASRAAAANVFREAARFALHMLVPGSDGRLIWSPSTSPENKFVTADGRNAAVSEGGGMDQELVREVLVRFLDLAGDDPSADAEELDLIDRARHALADLRPIGSGPNGLLEWIDDRSPAERGHRHLSHLFGLYPGTRIGEVSTPDDFAAARLALRTRLDAGTGHTGWSQAWVLCLAARLRDSELADQSMRDMIDKLMSPALLDLHPHGAPGSFVFQIDGNLGVIAGMGELLVQSHDGAVSLLRALPPSWSRGQARGLRTRGGHVVDLSWQDHELSKARLTVGRPGTIVLELPGQVEHPQITDSAGRAVLLEAVSAAPSGRRRVAWSATEAGEEFQILVAADDEQRTAS